MASPDVVQVSSANLDSVTAQASVIDFTATWCGPCQALAPVIDKMAAEFKGRVTVAKCDIDQNPDVASQFGVMGVPTLVFFKGGEIVDQHVGLLPEGKLRDKLNSIAK